MNLSDAPLTEWALDLDAVAARFDRNGFAGHFVDQERPEQVNRLLVDFLGRLTP
jgi:pimeloyl-ACP methyl ester carboxylesterase